jgi:hypothetical protein
LSIATLEFYDPSSGIGLPEQEAIKT